MALSFLLQALKNQLPSRSSKPNRRRFRPGAELLEDRTAPAVFIVLNKFDAGAGSLRAAIESANAAAGPDTINFNIPLAGVQTIDLTSPLPTLTGKVTIAGNTQPGFAGTPLIELNGTSAGAGANGLVMKAGSSVRAITINRFQGNGLLIYGSNCVVEGCFIGTDNTGAAAMPNQAHGVLIAGAATGVRIGGTLGDAHNLISGNAVAGVAILGALTKSNRVLGNFIGTNALGNADLGNALDGVLISGGSDANIIGGTAPGSANVISGNNSSGVEISGAGTTGNLVQGNLIGTNTSGTVDLGNTLHGVLISTRAAGNTVGGAVAGARNLISGNDANGVAISQTGTTGNRVQGNLIGTNLAGTADLGNSQDGVVIVSGAASNIVGGSIAAARNIISGNDGNGVRIVGVGTTANLVQGNFIGTDAAGAADVGNTNNGVFIASAAANNTVGGIVVGARNVISGNNSGAFIDGAGTTNNKVQGNFIGTDAAGNADLGNGSGVVLSGGAANNTVGGTVAGARNVISGNNFGVFFQNAGTTGNLVQGNFIGANAAGNADLGNSTDGVRISLGAANNTVGGIVSAARNVISGNNACGVRIQDAGTTGNKVQGNFIGTDATGNASLGNSSDSVTISGGAANNLIGGIVPGARNVISGSTGDDGIDIRDAGTTGNLVQGNFIGTNASGSAALPNNDDGIQIQGGATNNIVGGMTPAARNVISGNNGDGVVLSGATGNLVQGNFIGTNAAGTGALGNAGNGVQINVGVANNTIGGAAAGAGNKIAHNAGDGIFNSDGGSGNSFLRNSIFSNAGQGIDLGPNGPTANDPNDPDAGPNELLNTPILTSAFLMGTSLDITGFINTLAGKVLRIEFFASPSGGQGQTFLGFHNLTMFGNTVVFTRTLTVPASVLVGHKLTATITDELGNTSEFSIPMTIE